MPHVVVLRGVLSKRYAAMNISAWVSSIRYGLEATVFSCRVCSQSADLKRVFDTIRNDPKLTAERFETEVLKQ